MARITKIKPGEEKTTFPILPNSNLLSYYYAQHPKL